MLSKGSAIDIELRVRWRNTVLSSLSESWGRNWSSCSGTQQNIQELVWYERAVRLLRYFGYNAINKHPSRWPASQGLNSVPLSTRCPLLCSLVWIIRHFVSVEHKVWGSSVTWSYSCRARLPHDFFHRTNCHINPYLRRVSARTPSCITRSKRADIHFCTNGIHRP